MTLNHSRSKAFGKTLAIDLSGYVLHKYPFYHTCISRIIGQTPHSYHALGMRFNVTPVTPYTVRDTIRRRFDFVHAISFAFVYSVLNRCR